jgi:hypothetical protein
MTEYYLRNQYFDWLCRLVDNKKHTRGYSYQKLFVHLDSINFDYTIGMDGNRDGDGIDLRYRFGAEHKYEQPMIASILDVRPCSVFEMMIALSIRCEETIMNNPDDDYGPDDWFWIMLENLGLESMNDYAYDREYVDIVIHRFLNRDYEPNGEGGLFVVKNKPNIDLRNVEIWCQMCWFLDEYLRM